MMAKVLGFLAALSFVGSFFAFTWLRAVRYRARCVLEADGAEPEPSDVDTAVIRAVDVDLAKQERAAWAAWVVLTVACAACGCAAAWLLH